MIVFNQILTLQIKGARDEEQVQEWLEYTADRPYPDQRYPMDSSKLKNLGWFPKVDWKEGIDRTGKLTYI